MTQESRTLNEIISPLKPFVERTSIVRFPMKKIFSTCLKASFVNIFEFIDMASKEEIGNSFSSHPHLDVLRKRSYISVIYHVIMIKYEKISLET